jgi:hypothetical protein
MRKVSVASATATNLIATLGYALKCFAHARRAPADLVLAGVMSSALLAYRPPWRTFLPVPISNEQEAAVTSEKRSAESCHAATAQPVTAKHEQVAQAAFLGVRARKIIRPPIEKNVPNPPRPTTRTHSQKNESMRVNRGLKPDIEQIRSRPACRLSDYCQPRT